MIRLLHILLSVVLLVACNSNHSFVIDGTITNADDGEMVCLTYPVKRDGIWYKQCDSTYIDNGKFIFRGCVDGVVPAELSFQNMDFAQLFLEPSEIKFSAERRTLYDYSISGFLVDDKN